MLITKNVNFEIKTQISCLCESVYVCLFATFFVLSPFLFFLSSLLSVTHLLLSLLCEFTQYLVKRKLVDGSDFWSILSHWVNFTDCFTVKVGTCIVFSAISKISIELSDSQKPRILAWKSRVDIKYWIPLWPCRLFFFNVEYQNYCQMNKSWNQDTPCAPLLVVWWRPDLPPGWCAEDKVNKV